MAKQFMENYYRNIGIVVLMISCITAENWKMPTATDIQNAGEYCQIVDPSYESLLIQTNTNDIRCISTELGLWQDHHGFNAKRLAKLLSKHQQNEEIVVVVTYCNDLNRHKDHSIWATESFKCFAQGRMGKWIDHYIRNQYKLKTANKT